METLLKELAQLVSIKSVTSDRAICIQTLKGIQKKIPHSVLDQENGILFWGHTHLETTKWLINTHIDVVPAKTSQFVLKVKGDKAWGRGVADVKGGAAIMIASATDWLPFLLKNQITCMLVSDEEIGGTCTKKVVAKMLQLTGGLFLEPTGLHLTTEAKGMMQVRITSHGTPCHGSRPWEGKNAIENLAFCLTKFRLHNPSPLRETRETTFNFSQITGGEAINQVASQAELWCDVRVNPEKSSEEVLARLRASFTECEIKVVRNESAIRCPKESLLFTSLARSLKTCSINPLTQFDHGTSDARHLTALGIPSLVFGPKGGGLHAKDEWVSINSLMKVKQTLDHWVKNF